MLILSRKENESISIGEDIEITVIQTNKTYTKIGIKAPKSSIILRKELVDEIKDDNLHSIVSDDVKLDDLSKKLKK